MKEQPVNQWKIGGIFLKILAVQNTRFEFKEIVVLKEQSIEHWKKLHKGDTVAKAAKLRTTEEQIIVF